MCASTKVVFWFMPDVTETWYFIRSTFDLSDHETALKDHVGHQGA